MRTRGGWRWARCCWTPRQAEAGTPERIAQLKLLQQDPSPKVAGPAQAVFPPRELL
jgi:hypothetical protein